MRLKFLLPLFCLLLPSGGRLHAQTGPDGNNVISSEAEMNVELDCFVGGASVWKITPGEVESSFAKKGFAWLDEGTKTRGVIRPRDLLLKSSTPSGVTFKPGKGLRHKLTLFGATAYEATLEFSGDKLATVTISIWNKGDAGQSTSKPAFEYMVGQTVASMDTVLKSRGRDLGRDNSGAAKLSRWRWETPDTLAQLEHSSGKDEDRSFVGDFIRLRFAPKGGMRMDSTVAAPGKLGVAALATRVKKTAEGDVYVEGVPMVDQGEKGYCAVASTERVMRYYGIQVDQHDLAKAAETSQYGTRPQDFEDAIHRLQGRFKIRVRDLITFDQRDYERIVDNYNREAKKAGMPQWEPGDYYFKFNADIMREARCRAGAFEKFRTMITTATSRGVPLLWALSLGRYPETGRENPQGGGGHMRTIIGYNAKTDEVIFSDSWGAGHEIKKMKGRDACAATNGLYLVEPAAN
ncbi:C39 family peptidase [Luteolibacter yonseiensis]|uniref:C39 family peptidase n=1 Tax=Luteolibacter yonseiensis TaxID=1144680 RepID=A0A934R2S2_9BACT|nr:C39 family peptidase [Luteolibacter yonseiensis]MBK1815951.1 C39 family peptidase [Luteolibacter yonseiensis]